MIDDEDIERAEAYALIGRLFAGPPDEDLLRMLGGLTGDDGALGQSVAALACAAREVTPAEADAEFAGLFFDLNVRDAVSPYAAVHLTGSHFGEALLKLRGDLGEMGIGRAEGVRETEDHVSVLCQVMAGLTLGQLGQDVDRDRISSFFKAHIATWMPSFAKNVEATGGLRFYAAAARFARLFLAAEAVRFA